MNSQITIAEIHESATIVETPASDIEALTHCGYSEDEIISLLWLRQHYQSGGSDRASIVRLSGVPSAPGREWQVGSLRAAVVR